VSGTIHVGTCSWADPGFVAEWYPEGLPARERLAWYAQRFDAVEVDSPFYAIPARETVERWARTAPPGFSFDIKLPRLLSRHSTPVESLPPDVRERATVNSRGRVVRDEAIEAAVAERILDALAPLVEDGRLSSLLLQLTPAFRPDRNELSELDPLLARLAPHTVAVELRHRAWLAEDRVEATLGHLADRGAAFVCVDAPRGDAPTMMPPLDAVTNPALAYLRAHGRDAHAYMHGRTVAERFAWSYSDDELGEIRGRVEDLAAQAQDVRTMFNNNRGRDAPDSARRMRELLGQDPGPPVRPAGPAQQSLL